MKNKHTGSFIVILSIVFLFVALICLSMKENMFMDEYLSYSMATQEISPVKDNTFLFNVTYTDPETAFRDNLLAVGIPFNFRDVYIQTARDVHPPLYYYLLHSICSLFPGTFSVYYAGAINILFGLLTILVLNKFIRVFTEDLLTRVLILIVYIFSHAVVSQVIFLRMYVMLGFWVTALIYLFIREPLQKKSRGYYILLFLTIYGGISTHYHFLLVLAPACLIYLMILLAHKQYDMILKHTSAVLSACFFAYLSFPAMLMQLTSSERAAEATNVFYSPSDYLARIPEQIDLLLSNLFGYLYPLLIVLIICGLAVLLCQKEQRLRLIIVILSLLCWFILISLTVHFVALRYYFALYPLLIVLSFLSVFSLLKKFPRIGRYALVLTFLLFTAGNISAYRHRGMEYLYSGYMDKLNALEQYKDNDCLIIVNSRDMQAGIFSDMHELTKYRTFTLAAKDDMEPAAALMQGKDSLIIVTDDGWFYTSNTLTKEIQTLLQIYGLPDKVTDLGRFSAETHTYYCTRE